MEGVNGTMVRSLATGFSAVAIGIFSPQHGCWPLAGLWFSIAPGCRGRKPGT
jgi:hypothetical protein